LLRHLVMRIRLTRKLADYLDGIDLSRSHEGDVLELSHLEAQLLIAERWAIAFHGPPDEADSAASAARRATADIGSTRRMQAVEQLDRACRRMERTRFELYRSRRAEDRFREEFQDARARTIGGSS